MQNLFKLLLVVALLGVPLLVITAMPRFFDLVGSVPAVLDQQVGPTATPGFTLTDPAATRAPARFGALDERRRHAGARQVTATAASHAAPDHQPVSASLSATGAV